MSTTATGQEFGSRGVTHSENAPEGVKDTIESLVVAFILAFVFRGFLVEAFVIPTGSMAPTLYGMHGTQICPDCGFEYAYGMPQGNERDEIMCPNCECVSLHDEIPFHARGVCPRTPGRRLSASRLRPADAARLARLDFTPQSGDRILVFKWPFDLGGPRLGPRPWDVVVFKNPSDGENNYIKRLIGVPREVLQIIDGDVYTCSASALPPELLEDLDALTELKHEITTLGHKRLKPRYGEMRNRVAKQLAPHLRIRRKTAVAQQALWHLVFDQDYLPRPEREHVPHWKELRESGEWDTSSPVISFDGLQSSEQTIRFSGKNIEDYYAYNYGTPANNTHALVGDLRLNLVLHVQDGAGRLTLRLAKRDAVFDLRFDADGTVTLGRQRGRSVEVVDETQIRPWAVGDFREVEFANVDYRVYLRIDGELILETDDDQYSPNPAQLTGRRSRSGTRPAAEIRAEDLALEIRHLRLDRDVYYRSAHGAAELNGWGTEGRPIYLREGEYFVLGDNSPASQDSRLWQTVGPHLQDREAGYQLGTVPGDQLIGKAFFVYWPSGYRIHSLPVLKSFGIIPNVGKMRWIR